MGKLEPARLPALVATAAAAPAAGIATAVGVPNVTESVSPGTFGTESGTLDNDSGRTDIAPTFPAPTPGMNLLAAAVFAGSTFVAAVLVSLSEPSISSTSLSKASSVNGAFCPVAAAPGPPAVCVLTNCRSPFGPVATAMPGNGERGWGSCGEPT